MRNKKGFTLIELLVVIAIIGLLSTLAVVSLNGARKKARDAASASDARTLQTAIEVCANQGDAFPVLAATGTLSLTTRCGTGGQTMNQFIQEWPKGGHPDHSIRYWSNGTIYTIQYWLESTTTPKYIIVTGGGSGL